MVSLNRIIAGSVLSELKEKEWVMGIAILHSNSKSSNAMLASIFIYSLTMVKSLRILY